MGCTVLSAQVVRSEVQFFGNSNVSRTGELSTMQEDFDKERKAVMKQWGKREEQIGRAMEASWDCG